MLYLVVFGFSAFTLLSLVVFLWQQGSRLLKYCCDAIDESNKTNAMDPSPPKARIEPRFDPARNRAKK
jgi:hypothetical protein